MLREVYHVLESMDKRERRKRLVALIGGQSKMARAARVNRSTVCRVVAGWKGDVAAARVEGVIRHSLRTLSPELEQLWAA